MLSIVFRENLYNRGHVAFLYFKARRNFAEWKRPGEIGARGESKSVFERTCLLKIRILIWRNSYALITVTRSSIEQH